MQIFDRESRSHLENLSEHLIEYLDTKWDIILLKVTEKALIITSSLVSWLILAFIGGMVLLFAGFGTAIWLGMQLENPFAGYFIVAGVFIVVLILGLSLAHNYIRTTVTTAVLESIEDDKNENPS